MMEKAKGSGRNEYRNKNDGSIEVITTNNIAFVIDEELILLFKSSSSSEKAFLCRAGKYFSISGNRSLSSETINP